MNLTIRLENTDDYRAVEELTREAFWNVNVPGCGEHLLAHNLRLYKNFVKELDFVAEADGEIVGNIMYVRASVVDDDGTSHEVLSFGPISVLPKFQRQGVGSALIAHSTIIARAMGFGATLIYGSPKYYPRFGFRPAKEFGIMSEDGYYAAALQALELRQGALDGIKGRFVEGDVFELSDDALEEFEKAFEPKEKKETESQKEFMKTVMMREKA